MMEDKRHKVVSNLESRILGKDGGLLTVEFLAGLGRCALLVGTGHLSLLVDEKLFGLFLADLDRLNHFLTS